MELLHLPEEILLLILQAVSVADLARLRQSCRSLNAFVEQAEEVVYRAIASREGFVEQTTCSASAAVVDRPHEHGTESDALKRAIQAQRTMYEYYDDVQSWREFVKRRMLLDRSWRMGEAKEEWIQSPMTGRDGVFRFKLDPDARSIYVSSPQATVIAVSTDSRDLYSCYIARHWSHVEFSEGYLTHCTTRPSAVVVRRKMANTLPPPAPVRDERESEAPSEQQSFALEIDSVLEAPAPRNAPAPRIVAFKLRWPFHLSASPRPALLHLHDLRDGSVVSVDIQALFHIPHIAYDPCVHYIELIQDRLLIAGKVSVTSWHLEHACVATWPPRAPASTSDSLEESPSPPESIQHQPDHYRDWNPGDDDAFTAVHHDCRPGSSAHGNLVATFSNGRGCGGKIYWSPNAQLVTTYGASVEAVTQQTVVLVTDTMVTQLAVENGRAAFVTQLGPESDLSALWILDLAPFSSLDDFKRKPPQPCCVAFPLPLISAPYRLEMSADAIWVAGSSYLIDTHGAMHDAFQRFRGAVNLNGVPHKFQWEALDGSQLCDSYVYGDDSTQDEFQIAWNLLGRRAAEQAAADNHFTNAGDSLIAYRFG